MALRRSGVRIPLGPQFIKTSQVIKTCEVSKKVMAGVVGHPVSELGERGGSPTQRSRERSHPLKGARDRTRLATHQGDCAGESSSQRRVSPLSQTKVVAQNIILRYKPGGTAE